MVYSNYYTPVWYTPLSERDSVKPSSFLLKSPNYKLYSAINSSDVLPEGNQFELIDTLLLKECIIDYLNIEGLSNYTELDVVLQQELVDTIIKLFYPTLEFLDSLNFSLDCSLDSKLGNETWECSKCQEKGLDKQRNCPMRDEMYQDEDYTITVGNTTYTTCPMPNKNPTIISTAFESYRILRNGYLPEAGSYGEQPLLFCIMSQKVDEKIKYYENEQLNSSKAHKAQKVS